MLVINVVLGIIISCISLYFLSYIHFDITSIPNQYVFIVMFALPILFFLYLIFYRQKLLQLIKKWAYTKPQLYIDYVVSSKLDSKAEMVDFLLVSLVVTALLAFLFACLLGFPIFAEYTVPRLPTFFLDQLSS